MFKVADMSVWNGREDSLEGALGTRWYQQVSAWHEGAAPGVALFGFPCEQGVSRNLGRTGAKSGPQAIRRALASHAWHMTKPVYDAGDIRCDDCDLESAQQQLGDCVKRLLEQQQFPLIMGGGHEMAYGSWQGLNQFAHEQAEPPVIGIINFDAHFDLRAYEQLGSSGTPFKQIADKCTAQNTPFHYCCLGVAQSANTQALFARADTLGVSYRLDEQMGINYLSETQQQLVAFIKGCDWLYLTIDLDVLPAAIAPGVSAPAARGVGLDVLETLIADIKASGKLKLADIAELNPQLDIDQHTARTAARLLGLIAR
ncbi:formimidoylglutamase [Neptunomonas sp.]|uniref:formimidoylglutamase n=1 Tax=Neptunomonas sp. TaxID=1971898 RepID=UPI00356A7A69